MFQLQQPKQTNTTIMHPVMLGQLQHKRHGPAQLPLQETLLQIG